MAGMFRNREAPHTETGGSWVEPGQDIRPRSSVVTCLSFHALGLRVEARRGLVRYVGGGGELPTRSTVHQSLGIKLNDASMFPDTGEKHCIHITYILTSEKSVGIPGLMDGGGGQNYQPSIHPRSQRSIAETDR